jgi:hypothetical protein
LPLLFSLIAPLIVLASTCLKGFILPLSDFTNLKPF